MSDGSQIPPRFVPVLTEVVGEPQALPVDGPPQSGSVARDGAVAGKLPGHSWIGRRGAPGLPAHLPPLPDSLPPQAFPEMAAAPMVFCSQTVVATQPPGEEAPGAASTPVAVDLLAVQEQVVALILQKVDGVIEQRVRESIDNLVQEQMRSLHLRLSEEITSVVRQTVADAVSELAGPVAASGPERA